MPTNSHEQALVTAFHRAMKIPAPSEPTMLTPDQGALRYRLIDEEAREFLEASEDGDWLEMVDALVDLLYVTYGTAVGMGVELAPFFQEVHIANMRKEPGSDSGKSVKPEGWVAPDLAGVFKRVHGNRPLPVKGARASS